MYALNNPLSVKTIADLNFVSRSPLWRGFLVVSLTLVYFALVPLARAIINPPPDGGYPGGNTAEGDNALYSLGSGTYNTAIGLEALFQGGYTNRNTAVGTGALHENYANENTAIGTNALWHNTDGGGNTAIGASALYL